MKKDCIDNPVCEYIKGARGYIKIWLVNGLIRHRLDGPALEFEDGTHAWYINGCYLDQEQVEKWIQENEIDLSTQEGQTAFKLRFS